MSGNENGETSDVRILGEVSRAGQAASVPSLAEFVAGKAKEQGFSEKRLGQIGDALHEALTNIISHAMAGKTGDIHITCSLDRADRLVIAIVDEGRPFNMLLADDPFINPNGEDMRNVSTRTMKRMMDTIEYKRVDNKNVLTLTASGHSRDK